MSDPYPFLPTIGRKVYPPLGYCMYCGSTEELTSEHIVPFALGGEIELLDSSCKECAKITSKFERALLRGQLWRARLALGFKSRRKHRDAPTHTTVEFELDGNTSEEQVQREHGPAVVTFPVFPPPRLITGDSTAGVSVAGIVGIAFGKDPKQLALERGATKIAFTDNTSPYQFAQLLAKIALGMATATGAIQHLTGPSPLREIILGTNPNVGDYVGSMTDELRAFPGHLHRIAIFVDATSGYLVADVQLFAESTSPRYAVIIGSAKSAT